jgi:uncharacterized membrane protein YuzA (DUF378 family)
MHAAIRIFDLLTIVLALCLARVLGRRFFRMAATILTTVAAGAVIVRFWHIWTHVISDRTFALAKAILTVAQSHPLVSHLFHVVMNMVPDIAYLLIALAGLSYLMPKVVKKIENSPPLRAAVIILFVFFGLLAILVNAVNRTDQEERESQLRSKVEEVRGSVERVQTLLIK